MIMRPFKIGLYSLLFLGRLSGKKYCVEKSVVLFWIIYEMIQKICGKVYSYERI